MKYLLSLSWIFLTHLSFSQNLTFYLGGNFTMGNLFSYGVNCKSNLNININDKNQIVFTPNFDYGKISNQQGIFELRRKEILSVLNYEKTNGIFKYYIYNEIENSFLRKIRLRGSFGGGVSMRFTNSEKFSFDISQFVLPEVYMSSFSNKRDNWAIRLSTRLRFSRTFDKNRFNSQLLLQPAIYTELSDGSQVSYRDNIIVRMNNSYEYVLSKNLSVGLTTDVIYQTYSSFINPVIKPYDSNMNLFIKGSY